MCETCVKRMQELEETVKRQQMKLSALKVLLMHEETICSQKLAAALTEAEGCLESSKSV